MISPRTGALDAGGVPPRQLIPGGGIIGPEMTTGYRDPGAKVTIAELMAQLIPGVTKELISPLPGCASLMHPDGLARKQAGCRTGRPGARSPRTTSK